MHPFSPALTSKVSRVAATASLTFESPTDPSDLETSIRHALAELGKTRPRIVAFAPAIALKRVLALPGLRERFEHSPETLRMPPGERSLKADGRIYQISAIPAGGVSH
jgi:hypothetical protein